MIENLLTHYEALNEVIVLNMAFVLEHFDEVSLWLNSKEFKEKYEDINHPYPPLLNPDKLNDENYILNYEKIPANLAWEMNLPLPRRYEFV
ncbi:capsular biosynthesis protein, partial [Campylobacter upsaliensis]|nr:capsular biosynthesis protein [Campylobacter upsaliensis]